MTTAPVMTCADLEVFLRREFPQIYLDGDIYRVGEIGPMSARLHMRVGDRHLRPGGTVSGPTMMTLVDLAFYAVILAHAGPVALAVTTNLGFNFLRKPAPGDLVAEARLLKLGRRLAVAEASVVSEGSDDLVCHATGTYSLPPG